MGSEGFEELVFRYRKPVTLLLGGLILTGIGVIVYKTSTFLDSPKVEIIEKAVGKNTVTTTPKIIVAEISGEVQTPGVYKLSDTSRVDDLLIAAGGLGANADRDWVEKNINRASRISDGQKVYIPQKGESLSGVSINSTSAATAENNAVNKINGLLDINSASKEELESLPGIGPVYAQNIIEGRIYSMTDELISKGILKRSVFEKIKDRITVN